jgi:hypothetical protein
MIYYNFQIKIDPTPLHHAACLLIDTQLDNGDFPQQVCDLTHTTTNQYMAFSKKKKVRIKPYNFIHSMVADF